MELMVLRGKLTPKSTWPWWTVHPGVPEDSLPSGYHLLALFSGNKEGSQALMILRVRPTPSRFPIIILFTPVDDTPLHAFTSVKRPRERRTAMIA